MRIKKLRKELKKFQQEHGNLKVIIAGYHADENADGVELQPRFNPNDEPQARIW